MRILVACEYSGIVREAFRARGHNAVSCDLLPTEIDGPHIQGDVTALLQERWDMLIAFPPCTHLATSGACWFPKKQREQREALDFVRLLMTAPIERIAIENPVGVISTQIRKPDQIIQPYMFGHKESKRTCLWLKNLPLLTPTSIVEKEPSVVFSSGKSMPAWYNLPPSKNRAKLRSKTFEGIASAMAEQWSIQL